MPLVLQLLKTDPELPFQKVPGVIGVVDQDVLDREELGLAVHDHTGVGRDVALAVGESVKGIYSLVGRHVVRKVDNDLHLVGRHVLDLLDLYLALVLGLDD